MRMQRPHMRAHLARPHSFYMQCHKPHTVTTEAGTISSFNYHTGARDHTTTSTTSDRPNTSDRPRPTDLEVLPASSRRPNASLSVRACPKRHIVNKIGGDAADTTHYSRHEVGERKRRITDSRTPYHGPFLQHPVRQQHHSTSQERHSRNTDTSLVDSASTHLILNVSILCFCVFFL